MPKLAIGLPVHNGSKLLARTVESVLNQTYGDFELLIADNASTDATPEICAHFCRIDRRVRYVRHLSNIGAHPNFSYVFHHTHSPCFKWMAHDDILAPTFLARCVEVLDIDPSVVLAMSLTRLVNEDLSPLVFDTVDKKFIDAMGCRWPGAPALPELTSPDPAERFTAVVLRMVQCVEMYGVIRRSMLARTDLITPYNGSYKVMLAQLALLGRFHYAQEHLFLRTFWNGQGSLQRRRELVGWVGGGARRHAWERFHEIFMLMGYLKTIARAEVSGRTKARCLSALVRRASNREKLRQLAVGVIERS
jgi:glycosyltransferase involved in cell wall biosynthesis